MAKAFTHKEVRELRKLSQKILDDFSLCVKTEHENLTVLEGEATRLISSGYFDALVVNGLKKKENGQTDAILQNYLLLIYRAKQSAKRADECRALMGPYENRIKTCLDDLSVADNPITWLFTSRQNKECAQAAFDELNRIKNEPFYKSFYQVTSKCFELKNATQADVQSDFFENKKAYKTFLAKTCRSLLGYGGLTPSFRNYEDKFRKINDALGAIRYDFDNSAAAIKKSIDYMLASEMVNALRGIPVEQLGKEKQGIKVKCLKDGGFQNMADIFAASAMQIGSVYGISQDAAYTIKRLGDGYARQIRQGQKIKLSIDNKSKASTAVVKAIYLYLKKKDCSNRTDALQKECGAQLKIRFQTLDDVGNGCTWPFYSEKNVSDVRLAYFYVKQTMAEDFVPKASDISETYKSNAKATTDKVAWDDFKVNSILYFNVIEEVYPGVLGTDDSIYGLPEDLAREIQDECIFPDGLLCTLRRYQEWGVKYILHQEKVLLGDEMGLGKTVQAIAAMVSLKNTGATHFVVICPASVVTNWCREIVKHSRLKVTKIHGVGKASAFNSWLKTGGVAVANYESSSYLKMEDEFRFSLLVVDEAHFIKNPEARRSINTKNLASHTDRLLFMTGTALENNVDEMINLISILRPSLAASIESLAFMSSAPQFREKIAPVYYRRKREDVLTELPDKVEKEEWCALNPEEEAAYEDAVLGKRYSDARRVSWNINDLNKSSKACRLKEIVEEAEAEDRKVLVFSFFLDTIAKIYDFLRGECLNPITGSVNVNRRQEILDEFDKAPAGTVLLAQITSGGTGLNIQAASVVVICEPQFKPSIENQAISRAYRMGQARNVLVHRLLAENTVDEKLLETLKMKQEIFNAFADKSVAAQQQEVEVDDKTFGKIIQEEIDRIVKKRGLHSSDAAHSDQTNGQREQQASFSRSQGQERSAASSLETGKEYYKKIMGFTYQELVRCLIDRHGPAQFDYFTDESCSAKNKKVSRTSEGLFCHHIDEDKAIMLSNEKFAVNRPFAYQKADRLVYCNLLEHFLLHVLIFEESKNKNADPREIQGIGGAVNFICRQLNDLYGGYQYKQEWMQQAASVVKSDFPSYVLMLRRLWSDIKKDPILGSAIRKEQLAMGWDGVIYQKILNELN